MGTICSSVRFRHVCVPSACRKATGRTFRRLARAHGEITTSLTSTSRGGTSFLLEGRGSVITSHGTVTRLSNGFSIHELTTYARKSGSIFCVLYK